MRSRWNAAASPTPVPALRSLGEDAAVWTRCVPVLHPGMAASGRPGAGGYAARPATHGSPTGHPSPSINVNGVFLLGVLAATAAGVSASARVTTLRRVRASGPARAPSLQRFGGLDRYASPVSVIDEIGGSRCVSLVTYRRDGTPVATPVWHVVRGDELFIVSEADAWKVKRIRHDSRVTVTVCDVRGRTAPGAPSAEGTARLLDRQRRRPRGGSWPTST
jgi:Pyridoxamine 5'-phosphate oxidase